MFKLVGSGQILEAPEGQIKEFVFIRFKGTLRFFLGE